MSEEEDSIENLPPEKRAIWIADQNEVVDCRAQTVRWTRGAGREPEWGGLLEELQLDPETNLTDLEQSDWGNADSWGDMAEVCTYRYMPLRALNVDAVVTMVLWGGLTPAVGKLALGLLEGDPLASGEAIDGVLLKFAARALAQYDVVENRFPNDAIVWRSKLETLCQAAIRTVHEDVRRIAAEENDKPHTIIRRLEAGWIARKFDPYSNPCHTRQTLAEVEIYLSPPAICLSANVEILFRARERYEHVAERMARSGDAALEDWAKSDFPDIVRTVRFTIVRDRANGKGKETGVRLCYEANPPTVLQNSVGEVFPDTVTACKALQDRFGVPLEVWEEPDG